MIAAQILRDTRPATTKKEAERNVVQAIDHAASRLGNTRTVCRKYYVHPKIIEAYLRGEVLPPSPQQTKRLLRKPGGRLRKHEEEVLAFIRARLPEQVIPRPKAEGSTQPTDA